MGDDTLCRFANLLPCLGQQLSGQLSVRSCPFVLLGIVQNGLASHRRLGKTDALVDHYVKYLVSKSSPDLLEHLPGAYGARRYIVGRMPAYSSPVVRRPCICLTMSRSKRIHSHPDHSPRSSRIARSGGARRCCATRDLAIVPNDP